MTKVLICGDLAWADAEAEEMFAGLAEIIVSPCRPPSEAELSFFLFPSEWTLPTGLIS